MSKHHQRRGLFESFLDALTALKQGHVSHASAGKERFMLLNSEHPITSKPQANVLLSMFSVIVMRQANSSDDGFAFGLYDGDHGYDFAFRVPDGFVLNFADIDSEFKLFQRKLSHSVSIESEELDLPSESLPFVVLGPIPAPEKEFFEGVLSHLHYFGDAAHPLDFSRRTERDGRLYYYIERESYLRCFDHDDDFSPVPDLESNSKVKAVRTFNDLDGWDPADGQMN